MRLPTITANVRRPGGSMGVFTVETGIDTPDAALRTRVTQSAPRLRAAYAAIGLEGVAGALARMSGRRVLGKVVVHP